MHQGTVAYPGDRTSRCPLGRERQLEEVLRVLSDPGGARMVLVRGERGIGRTLFISTLAERLRAEGTAVLTPRCVPGDEERPLLLVLRLMLALEEHRGAMSRRRGVGNPSAEALHAAERGDRAVMAEALATALTQPAASSVPVAVVVDDAQYADAESLSLLGGIDLAPSVASVRLVFSAIGHTEGGTHRRRASVEAVGRLADDPAALTIVLPRLEEGEVAAVAAQRLRAVPIAGLVRRLHELSRGIPGAVDALLGEWTRQDPIRMAGHAFLSTGTSIPVLPDDDRFIVALDALGEPCRTVAEALSVLWPLGRRAAELTAASTGLSADAVSDGIRVLVDAGILDALPGRDGAGVRGWTFRVPLVAHALWHRLGPLERGRLSAAAVKALWARGQVSGIGATEGPRTADILEEADAEVYLPDRIADAGVLVDRGLAVAELTAAAERLYPDYEGRGTLRWFRAAARLTEEPAARAAILLRYARAAYTAGDYPTARTASLQAVRTPAAGLGTPMLQSAASVLVAATAACHDWADLSRMATAQWWHTLPLPAPAAVTGRALAQLKLARWQEGLELLARSESLWNTDPGSRALPELYAAGAELVVGRPGRFARLLAGPEIRDMSPDQRYALAIQQFDQLLCSRDLRAAEALLSARGLTLAELPPCSVFLWHHLRGRWDEALESARRLLATDRVFTPASDHHLLPARTADILLARGRITTAGRLIDSARDRAGGHPSEHSLDRVEAEALRAFGDAAGAEQALRRGLRAASRRGEVHGTDELWAALAVLLAETGRTGAAVRCLRRLERIAGRLDSGRSRLLLLVTSAKVLGQDCAGTARRYLGEAVDLARSRGQVAETALTLTAAAGHAGPATLLYEAYELFGECDALLWRFRTRVAQREARLTVPGRRQATDENERLFAVLIAEGLTNRRIATVLGLSEDAVANRLTRLFARTGLRSRTELVTAVLTGGVLAGRWPLTGDDRPPGRRPGAC
ncbi:LuxR family transcriptional regulator [Streptomyces sp. 5-6(2022)]|uniref:AAA family ATPase n=1 Tax=Streptomyces sp. 5-6(2022) TaxID=2936510 RepID=UPI0023B8DBDD|nr:LuxR family transcriptional regulator [Streptomyces sp. 5-6(2022)]